MKTVTAASTKAIQRRLSLEFGLKSCKPVQKPRLTRTMKKKRLDFAKRHASWDIEMSKKVLFSDEPSVQQFFVRRYRVWRCVGARFEEKYTTLTMKHPPSQMIWGAMSFMGPAGLCFLSPEMTINGEKNVDLLNSKLEFLIRTHSCTFHV